MSLLNLCKKLYNIVLIQKGFAYDHPELTDTDIIDASVTFHEMLNNYNYCDIKACLSKVSNECNITSAYPALNHMFYISSLHLLQFMNKYYLPSESSNIVITELVLPMFIEVNEDTPVNALDLSAKFRIEQWLKKKLHSYCELDNNLVFLKSTHRKVEPLDFQHNHLVKCNYLPTGSYHIAIPFKAHNFIRRKDFINLDTSELSLLENDILAGDLLIQGLGISSAIETLITPLKVQFHLFLQSLPTSSDWIISIIQSNTIVITIDEVNRSFSVADEIKECLIYQILTFCDNQNIEFTLDLSSDVQELLLGSKP
ncbi:hypothetical protein BCU68_12145 [Vibrio sp. 10N.286.49.B3]|uniref:hypothetical protein n=1 Tax=Vibrio sp. 10N.286.49.B3 TaxID=1880855 RepID=UPI000C821143|nr:hypothetical protein [Vibrio sp. 10N.286.49.B3]PMH44887.1 hypothetical protein BCU68_12145 [Vibrio sp. 10N.286.49.B3]